MSLSEALALGGSGVISLVGAGGKTTLLYSLAAELAAAGQRVLTTTTTKIYPPAAHQSPHLVLSDDLDFLCATLPAALAKYRHLTVAAGREAKSGKLYGLPAKTVDRLFAGRLADTIIVEADGAAGRPLKAFAPHEPVVPVSTGRLVYLLGLTALGRPLSEEWVFRAGQYSRCTGLAAMAAVSEESVVAMLDHDLAGIVLAGGALRILLCTQAESEQAIAAGHRLAELLAGRQPPRCFDRVVVATLAGSSLIRHIGNLKERVV